MADTQRIYPAQEDLEKNQPPSVPLAPKSSLVSEKGDPAANQEKVLHVQVPKDQVFPARQAPRYHSRPPKRRRGFCCRCLTWTFCLLLILIVAIVVAGGILYLVFKPKVPKYSVESIQITNFSVNANGPTISSQFAVDVTARNPNKKIGIYYLGGSHIGVSYTGTELCRGSLPAFYQGHKNTTNLNLTLTGTDVQITNEMTTSLSAQQQEGKIPLKLKADVPVKIKVGKLKLFKITFRMRCDIVVDKLEANTDVNINSKKCNVKLKL